MAIGGLSRKEIEELLADLREGLLSDGYELRVATRDDKIALDIVTAREDACADCLVPKDVMAQIAAMALQERNADVTADDIALTYPVEH